MEIRKMHSKSYDNDAFPIGSGETPLTELKVEPGREPKTVIDESVILIEEVFREIRRTNKVPLLDIRRQMIQMIHQTVEQQYLSTYYRCSRYGYSNRTMARRKRTRTHAINDGRHPP
jgi:hypothetical protein